MNNMTHSAKEKDSDQEIKANSSQVVARKSYLYNTAYLSL